MSFKEFDQVISISEIENIPIGTHGTIVHDYGVDGIFEVEFFNGEKTIGVETVLEGEIQKI